MSESTSRSSANVTVLRGTLDSLLMALGGIGPRLLRQSNTTRALLGNLKLGIISHPLNVVYNLSSRDSISMHVRLQVQEYIKSIRKNARIGMN